MFKTTDLHRTVTSAIGAMLVSLAFVGAAVGPAHAADVQSVETYRVASGQSFAG